VVGGLGGQDTSKEWTLAAHGAMTQSVVVATSYATLGMDALVSSLHETSCTVILTNKKKVAAVAKAALAGCPKLKTIIYSNHMCEPGSPAPEQVCHYPSSASTSATSSPPPRLFCFT
jgi:long-subunit acyl-CoA synthetase (AMP-forming)